MYIEVIYTSDIGPLQKIQTNREKIVWGLFSRQLKLNIVGSYLKNNVLNFHF